MTDEQKKRFAEALDRVAGDCDLLTAMASMVAEDAPGVLNDLKEQVADNDMAAVASTAHKLKGMLSTFETGGPVLELEELIADARRGNSEQVSAALDSCAGDIEKLVGEITMLEEVA